MPIRNNLVNRMLRAVTPRTERPPPPPPEAYAALPWGAIHTLPGFPGVEPEPPVDLNSAPALEIVSRTADGRPQFAILALSGGGARGAFGAGLMSGWTRSGTRPQFAAVTGISTGALMGTFAFLGPDYDGELERFYTSTKSADIFSDRGLSGFLADAVKDSKPLKRLIEGNISERILDAVAKEHNRGRRFLVATTNLDSAHQVVWDMGAIAASGRADRLQRFRDVLLASSSIPMVFPPVYFPVEWEGKTYWQMHVDGGAAVVVFLSGFLVDELNRVTGLRTEHGDAAVDLYIVLNEDLPGRIPQDPVEPNLLGIAEGMVRSLTTAATVTQLVRLYRAAHGIGFGFHFAGIPADYPHRLPATHFDPEAMRRLFDYAQERAGAGYPWLTEPPSLDPREIVARLPTQAKTPPPEKSWATRTLERLGNWIRR